jgi:hypothetical protein
LTKKILEKNITKQKKNLVGKHRSNPQYFKEKNYKVKFLTSSILKKLINIILKNKKIK